MVMAWNEPTLNAESAVVRSASEPNAHSRTSPTFSPSAPWTSDETTESAPVGASDATVCGITAPSAPTLEETPSLVHVSSYRTPPSASSTCTPMSEETLEAAPARLSTSAVHLPSRSYAPEMDSAVESAMDCMFCRV